MRRIERLFEPANYDAGGSACDGSPPSSSRRDGATTSARNCSGSRRPYRRRQRGVNFEQATVAEIPAEAELDAPARINVADVEGTRAQHP